MRSVCAQLAELYLEEGPGQLEEGIGKLEGKMLGSLTGCVMPWETFSNVGKMFQFIKKFLPIWS